VTAENANPIEQDFIVSNEHSFITVRRSGEPNPVPWDETELDD